MTTKVWVFAIMIEKTLLQQPQSALNTCFAYFFFEKAEMGDDDNDKNDNNNNDDDNMTKVGLRDDK